MQRKYKFLIALGCFIFLFWFLSVPMSSMVISRPYAKAPTSEHTIDVDELNAFLTLWSQIMQGPLKNHINQVSLNSTSQYPSEIVKWLEIQNWNVERFFYDEQRIREILSCITLKNNMEGNKNLSRLSGTKMKKVISNQREELKNCRYPQEELSLIKDNMYTITEVLSGKAILSK